MARYTPFLDTTADRLRMLSDQRPQALARDMARLLNRRRGANIPEDVDVRFQPGGGTPVYGTGERAAATSDSISDLIRIYSPEVFRDLAQLQQGGRYSGSYPQKSAVKLAAHELAHQESPNDWWEGEALFGPGEPGLEEGLAERWATNVSPMLARQLFELQTRHPVGRRFEDGSVFTAEDAAEQAEEAYGFTPQSYPEQTAFVDRMTMEKLRSEPRPHSTGGPMVSEPRGHRFVSRMLAMTAGERLKEVRELRTREAIRKHAPDYVPAVDATKRAVSRAVGRAVDERGPAEPEVTRRAEEVGHAVRVLGERMRQMLGAGGPQSGTELISGLNQAAR